MYNNIPQQNPYMYGYNMPGYQRMMPVQTTEAPAPATTQSYTAPIMMPQ
jgi:hypothetical protein